MVLEMSSNLIFNSEIIHPLSYLLWLEEGLLSMDTPHLAGHSLA
jgi:hypothetical protein